MNKEKPLTAADEPKLSKYQNLMLNAFKAKPELMQLLKVIFDDYPKIIVAEIMCLKGVTHRRQKKGIELGTIRMKMEAFIEEKIARLAGIDVDGFALLQKEEDEKSTQTKPEVKIDQEQIKKIEEAVAEEIKKLQDGPVFGDSEGKGENGKDSSSSS